MNSQLVRQHVYPEPSDIADETVKRIALIADSAIQERGHFSMVLSGGSTPRQTYQLLRDHSADWQHWHIYFGDERCLPADDPERNSLMAKQAWLDHVPIPGDQVHIIPAELGAEAAAEAYAQMITTALPFDLVLLGMGEDGHTASLFPGHENDLEELVHAIHHAPKPPPDRVSLSVKCLSQSRNIIIQVTGSNKQQALSDWLAGIELPVSRVKSENGVDLLVDEKALVSHA
jgi:6-phosphogluconolactonase